MKKSRQLPAIKKSPEQEYYPVSLQQEGVWLQSALDVDNPVWNSSQSIRYGGELNIEALKRAILELIQRQASLKTNFKLIDEKIFQVVHDHISIDTYFSFFDLSFLPGEDKRSAALAIEEKAAKKPYDLENAPLIRFTIIRLDEYDHVINICRHHIISDMTSRQLLWKELVTLYNAYAADEAHGLEPVPIQYFDYAVWQQEFLSSSYYRGQKQYWLSELSGMLPLLNVLTDFPRKENVDRRVSISVEEVRLDREFVSRLRTFTLRRRVSLSAPFLTAYYILLNTYTSQDDMVIGGIYQGRNIDKGALNKIIGLFANRIGMRLNINMHPGLRCKELLGIIDNKLKGAYWNQDFLFEDLIRTLQPERAVQHAAVFQAVFNMVKAPPRDIELRGLKRKQWQGVDVDTNISSRYDLTIYVRDEIKDISIKILYPVDLFKQQTIKRFLAQYHNILEDMVTHPDKKAAEIDFLTEEEKQLLLYKFTDTGGDYPKDKTIHELFMEQVEKTPDHIAAVGGGLSITYNELNEKSDQLAGVLRGKGVEPDDMVGILVERSVEMVMGMLGILKSGGAYLPLDLAYPAERNAYMLKDCNAKMLLASPATRGKVESEIKEESIELIDISAQLSSSTLTSTSICNVGPANLAYIIYTSGSTGKPKGVMIEHRGAINFFKGMMEKINFSPGKVILALATISFDISVMEILMALTLGLRVVVADEIIYRDFSLLKEFIEKTNVEILQATPTRMQLFAMSNGEGSESGSCLRHVKEIIIGGEAFPENLLTDLKRLTPARIYNVYGPTETTVWCTVKDLTDVDAKDITIGQPIVNTQIYILDRNHRLQPVGVIGELCLTNDGKGRGYLCSPELTHEKYVPNPYKPGRLMYKSGDLARWLPDGNLEFLGRIDFQVKVRGFRIELGEIEALLNKHPGIKEAVVTAIPDASGKNILCAYIIRESKDKEDLNIMELREYLGEELPDYMVPSYFIEMEKFPLTRSNKTNRKALPKPEEGTGMAAGADYEAPQNDAQEKLAAIWEEVLGLEKVGINHNFFAVGGDSIKAIQAISRFSASGYRIDIALLFKYPTIKELSRYAKPISGEIDRQPQQTVIGDIPLAPIQQWFIQRDFTGKHHWNLAMMVCPAGEFEPHLLEKVFKRILEHHDMLRAVLSGDEKIMINKGTENIRVPMEVFDWVSHSREDLYEEIKCEANRIQRSMDLYQGPLVKAGLFKTREGDHLLIAAHHLVIDGLSWRILLDDISFGYEQAKQGDEILFPAKTHSYMEWSEALHRYGNSNQLMNQYEYWRDTCSAAEKPLIKSFLGVQGAIFQKSPLADYYRFKTELDEEESRLMLERVNHAYNTEINDILLSGLSLAVKECFGLENAVINLEGHGREQVASHLELDVSRTVGWFTAQFPVLLEARESDDLSMHIRRTKEILRKIPHKGIGYGILRYISQLPEAERKALEIEPEISFNYMGRFDEDLRRFGLIKSRFNGSIGDSKNPESQQVYKISINGALVNSRLAFFINGDRNTLIEKDIQRFGRSFKRHLQEIIRHCGSVEETVYTPADYDAPDLDFEELAILYRHFDNDRNNVSKIYNLSPMQEGMLFHHLYDPESRAYTVQLTYLLEGGIDRDRFGKSLEKLVEKHDIFRTAVVFHDLKRPRQVVLESRPMECAYHDITLSPDKDKEINILVTADRARGFHLVKDILIRFTLIKKDKNTYLFLITYHHIIMDGWSINIWLKDFLTFYQDSGENKGLEPRPAVSYRYSDYIDWLEQQDMAPAHAYWGRYLDSFEQVTRIQPPTLPHDFSIDTAAYQRQDHTLQISKEISDRLSELANRMGVTRNNVIQGVWSVILQRYSGADDLVFGNVISGRNIQLQGVEQMVGLFINTIPLRIKTKHDLSFAKMVKKIQVDLVESQRYGYLTLADVQAHAAVEGQVFEHLYIYENYPINRDLTSNGMAEKVGFKTTRLVSMEHTNYHLNLVIIPRDDILIRLQYNENVYPHSFAARLAAHIEQVIHQVMDQPEISISAVQIVTEEEKQQLLYEFNDTARDYARDKTIHELFMEQVEKTPDLIAVIGLERRGESGEQIQITYKKLNEKADGLARVLRGKGVQPDNNPIVGLMVERSVEMIISMLGILKAGGAYLPMDPEYPAERIKYMLEDSGAEILLATESTEVTEEEGTEAVSPVVGRQSAASLAYLIYTSGSTGKPKGVMIEHMAVNNFIAGIADIIDFSPGKSILALTTISFDIFVLETLLPLSKGLCVVIADENQQKDPFLLGELIQVQRLDMLQATPSRIQMLTAQEEETGVSCLRGLKEIMVGGEPFPLPLFRTLKQLTPAKIYNMYGPTETTVWSAVKDLTDVDRITIGYPIANTRIYILDKYSNLQPVGVPGDLFIGGDGLARGYYKNPELTAEKFSDYRSYRTYSLNFSKKLYKTGDLARWLPDGDIEFLGRSDNQVKIRGFRIELGEIESLLDEHSGIKESVVVPISDKAGESGVKSLCAYIVEIENNPEDLTVEELRAYLEKQLPDYMIPSYFVPIDRIPLTPNGKVNRKALPEPDRVMGTGVRYEAPGNEVEEKLAAIWRDILKVEKVGINDNFFSLGGHSLKAVRLIAYIKKDFKVDIPLRELFRSPVIKELSRLIGKSETSDYLPLERVGKRDYYPVSPVQRRLYFIQQLEPESTAYNLYRAYLLKGEVDLYRIQMAFEKLVAHHDVFRASFEVRDGEPVMVTAAAAAVDFRVEYAEQDAEGGREDIEELARAFIRVFDLKKPPLLRAKLIKVGATETSHLLLVDMHHIITDGESMEIFTRDFIKAYKGENLEERPVTYMDFTVWQHNELTRKSLERQKEYWLTQFAGDIPVLDIPIDYSRPPVQSDAGDRVTVEAGKELTGRIHRLAAETGSTLYMVLLAAFYAVLARFCSQEDIVIGTPVENRPHLELENIIGIFLNTLALRNYPTGTLAFRKFLEKVKENVLKAFENQDYQFEELVEQLNVKRDLSRSPLFDVFFNLLNMERVLDIRVNGLQFQPYRFEKPNVKFDITVSVFETDDVIRFVCLYRTTLFKKSTIRCVMDQYMKLLSEAAEHPDKLLKDYKIFSREHLEDAFKQVKANQRRVMPVVPYEPLRESELNQSIVQRFETQVRRYPGNLAIKTGNDSFTYEALNRYANRAARAVLAIPGYEPGHNLPAALLFGHGAKMVVGLLGVLKAGGCYFPLEPDHPEERLIGMLRDTMARVIVTDDSNLLLATKLCAAAGRGGTIRIVNIDNLDEQESGNPNLPISPRQPAYILYTSGSTGSPKGVIQTHQNVLYYIGNYTNSFHIHASDRISLLPLYIYDAAVVDIFGALLNGAALYPYNIRGDKGLENLPGWLRDEEITIYHSTATLFRYFIAAIGGGDRFPGFPHIRVVILGGEAQFKPDIDGYREYFPDRCIFVNTYGTTEATTVMQFLADKKTGITKHSLPLGCPIQGTGIYLMDEWGEEAPVYGTGELVYRSDHLAAGYLNSPEKNREAFMNNPFTGKGRAYRSGDLGRLLPDGNIEFVGRNDQQVKLRGNRIELNEIETHLKKMEPIKDCVTVVVTGKDGEPFLAVYYAARSGMTADKEELRQFLRQRLPDYMVPSFYIPIAEIPLTSTGKVARKLLPVFEPEKRPGAEKEYTPPGNKIEEQLVEIWQGILNVEKAGIKDNFFELGGHSLRAMNLVSQIHKRTGIEIPLKEVFNHPTIIEMAAFIQREEEKIKKVEQILQEIEALSDEEIRAKY